MTSIQKKLIFVSVAIVLYASITVFATWGFDPSSWRQESRVTWCIFLVTVIGLTFAAPFEDDRP